MLLRFRYTLVMSYLGLKVNNNSYNIYVLVTGWTDKPLMHSLFLSSKLVSPPRILANPKTTYNQIKRHLFISEHTSSNTCKMQDNIWAESMNVSFNLHTESSSSMCWWKKILLSLPPIRIAFRYIGWANMQKWVAGNRIKTTSATYHVPAVSTWNKAGL